ncbi:hypothetical protein BDQ17DRAFT_439563 [Cyathus striatus]|nr:hypothetical protein BDQ17DRAFT_439563 [Cyathus striatus]
MQFFALAAAVLPVLAVNAADILISVGDGGLAFNPTSVTANVGDSLQFQFVSGNHSVAQSTFPAPCTLSPGGIVSGFMNVTQGQASVPQWSVLVNDTSTPLWFYCQQTTPKNHCQSGMVFAVNPTANKTFAAFQQAAMGTTGNSTATTSGSGSASAPGATGSSSGSAGSAASGSTSGSAATSSQTSSANNGGVKVAGSAASLMAIVGLVAGLAL